MVTDAMKEIKATGMERIILDLYFFIGVQVRHADKVMYEKRLQGKRAGP